MAVWRYLYSELNRPTGYLLISSSETLGKLVLHQKQCDFQNQISISGSTVVQLMNKCRTLFEAKFFKNLPMDCIRCAILCPT